MTDEEIEKGIAAGQVTTNGGINPAGRSSPRRTMLEVSWIEQSG
jgi:hypothetical protein